MYICKVTGNQSKLGEKLNKITVATRDRIYTKRVKNEETGKWEDVEIGRGWEIAREIDASDEGVALWTSWSEEERTMFLKHLDS
jgi:hypothetical protein